VNPEPSLAQFLSGRARQASDARLAIDVAAGFVVLLAASLWRGPGWIVIGSASLGVLAYGTWGITDRELGERASAGRRPAILRIARTVAVIVGAAAAIGFTLSAFAVVLGPIKS
jgi:hypothetical protein